MTIEREPISSVDLMERAATMLADEMVQRWPDTATPMVFFAGSGNNGGDALAVARLLCGRGYEALSVYLFDVKGELSPDCRINKERLSALSGVDFHVVSSQFVPPVLTASHVVVDGLFGSGLNKPLSGGFAAVVKFINASPATVVAIDIPSGLMGEENPSHASSAIVHADLTLSLQFPKLSFLFAENEPYVGEWQVLDIGLDREAVNELETDYRMAEPEEMALLVRRRGKFTHKGNYGKALLIAGSQGMAGASVLAARACLRAGVGLLTVHVPFCNHFIVQTSVPEAMTQVDSHEYCFSEAADTDDYQAIAIGPGLGRFRETEEALLEQITDSRTPMVVDADALNLLAEHRAYIGRLPEGSILTPHPKELERLVGRCRDSYERLMKAKELAAETGVHVVLKGAFTAIVTPHGRCWFNSTGNPGMATAGSGDVLTGVMLALLAQGYDTESAARLGVCLHGLAGDCAARKFSEEGMTAGDIVSCLPMAWKMLHEMAGH